MKTDYFSQRRTVRQYQSKDIPNELINKIIEDAMRAPTTGNMQLYSVVVNRDTEMKKKLAPAHFNQPTVESCGALLTVCADFNRFTRWCNLSQAEPGYNNFFGFLTAMTDAVIFAQQICTVAEMNGLGTCYLGTVTYNAPMITEILGLPELVVPVCCLTLGWPASEPEQCERLPLKAVMHEERYRDDSDEEILELFKAKDEFLPNQPFIHENGKRTLAQVFTDVRYPGAMFRGLSQEFGSYLRKQGFGE